MQPKEGIGKLLAQSKQLYDAFDKHLRLMEPLIAQLKLSGSDEEKRELILYAMELSNDKMKSIHCEIGKHLNRLLSRKLRYEYAEEKINGD